MPTASRLQLDFWQSGPDAQLVQRKLGCALVELRQLTLAGNLGMQATEASLLLASKITTVAVTPWEMSVGCIRVSEASGCISGLEIHLQQLV